MKHSKLVQILCHSALAAVLAQGSLITLVFYLTSVFQLSPDTRYAFSFILIICTIIAMFFYLRKDAKLYQCILLSNCSIIVILNKLYIPKTIISIFPLPAAVTFTLVLTVFLLLWFLPNIINYLSEAYHSAEIEPNEPEQEKTIASEIEEPSKQKSSSSRKTVFFGSKRAVPQNASTLFATVRHLSGSFLFIVVAGIALSLIVNNSRGGTPIDKWSVYFESIIQSALLFVIILLFIGAIISLSLRMFHSFRAVITSPEKGSSDLWIYLACIIVAQVVFRVVKDSNNTVNDVLNYIIDDGSAYKGIWYAILILITANIIFSVANSLSKLKDKCANSKDQLGEIAATVMNGITSMLGSIAGTIFGDEGIRHLLDENYDAYVLGEDYPSPDNKGPQTSSGQDSRNDNPAA